MHVSKNMIMKKWLTKSARNINYRVFRVSHNYNLSFFENCKSYRENIRRFGVYCTLKGQGFKIQGKNVLYMISGFFIFHDIWSVENTFHKNKNLGKIVVDVFDKNLNY